jgi:Cys-tRNA synthase (O-phospho-L-seryl-tRNA:Cys-tRNA synthase)
MGKKTLPNWEVFQVAWNEHANAPLSTMFRSFSHEKNRINAWKKRLQPTSVDR